MGEIHEWRNFSEMEKQPENSNTANHGKTYQGRPRTCGFRLPGGDLVVLCIGALASFTIWDFIGELSVMILFTVGHFFLFCNVFRVRRKPELIWAVVFVLNMTLMNFTSETYGMLQACGVQFILTIAIIIESMRRPDYHGVLSRRINGKITDYLCG